MRVLVANLADGLSNPSRAREIVGFVREIEPDVAVMPEAYREGDEEYRQHLSELDAHGYVTLSPLYGDVDGRGDRHGLAVAISNRCMPGSPFAEVIHLGPVQESENRQRVGRAALKLVLCDPQTSRRVQVVAVHGDDRGEYTRLVQTRALIEQLDPQSLVTIVAGDLNATHGFSIGDALLRGAGQLASEATWWLPPVEPGTPKPANVFNVERVGWQLGRWADLTSRLGEMATGSTLAILKNAGFHDADGQHRPTMVLGPVRVQLDHVMVRGAESKAHPIPVKFSDHYALLAEVDLLRPLLG